LDSHPLPPPLLVERRLVQNRAKLQSWAGIARQSHYLQFTSTLQKRSIPVPRMLHMLNPSLSLFLILISHGQMWRPDGTLLLSMALSSTLLQTEISTYQLPFKAIPSSLYCSPGLCDLLCIWLSESEPRPQETLSPFGLEHVCPERVCPAWSARCGAKSILPEWRA
jgi:hypothetical protein